MNRLAATLVCDIQLQIRNGFYYAAGFVALINILILAQLPSEALAHWMPLLILSNLLINTFYFVAGQVLLEKGEGTLHAQVVTPLKNSEYLASKVLSLTLLSLLENLLIVLVGYGTEFNPVLLVSGMIGAAAMYTLCGFVAVSKYSSINEYLFPSFLYTLAFIPPFFPYGGFEGGWFLYLHPLQAPLILVQGAFTGMERGELVYGAFASLVWVIGFFVLGRRVFVRFIVTEGGTG
jgi:fluoroquinolone transport system permease protein